MKTFQVVSMLGAVKKLGSKSTSTTHAGVPSKLASVTVAPSRTPSICIENGNNKGKIVCRIVPAAMRGVWTRVSTSPWIMAHPVLLLSTR